MPFWIGRRGSSWQCTRVIFKPLVSYRYRDAMLTHAIVVYSLSGRPWESVWGGGQTTWPNCGRGDEGGDKLFYRLCAVACGGEFRVC